VPVSSRAEADNLWILNVVVRPADQPLPLGGQPIIQLDAKELLPELEGLARTPAQELLVEAMRQERGRRIKLVGLIDEEPTRDAWEAAQGESWFSEPRERSASDEAFALELRRRARARGWTDESWVAIVDDARALADGASEHDAVGWLVALDAAMRSGDEELALAIADEVLVGHAPAGHGLAATVLAQSLEREPGTVSASVLAEVVERSLSYGPGYVPFFAEQALLSGDPDLAVEWLGELQSQEHGACAVGPTSPPCRDAGERVDAAELEAAALGAFELEPRQRLRLVTLQCAREAGLARPLQLSFRVDDGRIRPQKTTEGEALARCVASRAPLVEAVSEVVVFVGPER
jgi:hypothetical protein